MAVRYAMLYGIDLAALMYRVYIFSYILDRVHSTQVDAVHHDPVYRLSCRERFPTPGHCVACAFLLVADRAPLHQYSVDLVNSCTAL